MAMAIRNFPNCISLIKYAYVTHNQRQNVTSFVWLNKKLDFSLKIEIMLTYKQSKIGGVPLIAPKVDGISVLKLRQICGIFFFVALMLQSTMC